jgi:signal transduction histidine kinase
MQNQEHLPLNMALIFQSMPYAAIIIDQYNTVQHINRQACKLLNINTENEIIGKNYEEVVHSDNILSKHPEASGWSSYLANRWLAFHITRMTGENNQYLGAILSIENQTTEVTAKQLFFTFSSEFLTPLTIVAGYSEILSSRNANNLTDDQRKMISIIHGTAKKLLTARQELLEEFRKVIAAD